MSNNEKEEGDKESRTLLGDAEVAHKDDFEIGLAHDALVEGELSGLVDRRGHLGVLLRRAHRQRHVQLLRLCLCCTNECQLEALPLSLVPRTCRNHVFICHV